MDKLLNYQCECIIKRIMKKSAPSDNGCIDFHRTKHKYGLVGITFCGKRSVLPAHRAMWMAKNKTLELDRNTVIRHKCDNPRCVNIEHLEVGTHKDNAKDCTERGRRAKKHKLHTRQRVHDDDKIRAIRAATGKHKWIAQEYGVSVGYVSKLRAGTAKALVK